MKKLISSLLFASLLILPANPIFAANESVSFFDALGNFSKVEDYKLVQSLYGSAEFDDGTDRVGGEFKITVSSAVDSGDADSSSNRINAYLKFVNRNAVTDATPFKEMTVQASVELITKNKTEMYAKLNNFNVSLKDGLPFALTDIKDAKSMIDSYKGVWYHTKAEELATETLPTDTATQIDVNKYIGLEEQFKKDPKEAVLGLTDLILQDSESGMTKDEMSNVKDAIKLAFDTKFFTVRPVTAGQNTGFNFFTLNKSSVISFLSQFATLMGEELNTDDVTMVRSVLGKFSLSGLYRIDDVYGLIDNLMIRFKIGETGPVKNLELNYRYKATDLNKNNVISAPSEFQELSDVMGAPVETGTDTESGL